MMMRRGGASLGAPAGEDIRRLEGGVQIVSGTPGRVFDMIKRRVLQTRDIKILVLDEADEMLSKGFKEQIYDVYRCGWSPGRVGFGKSGRLNKVNKARLQAAQGVPVGTLQCFHLQAD